MEQDRLMGRGSRVVYKRGADLAKHGARYDGEDSGLTAGIYTIVDTDDYVMCGMVEIEDALGRRWGVDASLLELTPADSASPK